jgi:S-adenosylmethionine:tRNA ribosyltransferase-isomerase
MDGRTGTLEDLAFHDFSRLVGPQDVLVFNDTKVIKARLRGRKDTGGEVEVLVERVLDEHRALAHVRASKTPKAGRKLVLTGGIEAEVLGRKDDLYELRFEGGATVLDQLAAHGEVPLPPYITHKPDESDESRYQTVYAKEPGAVAAPTAGLHFDTAALEGLRSRGIPLCHVTLHVGAGTFQPVRGDDVATHVMHSEWYSIPEATVTAIAKAKANKGRVIAVGTTTLRALEARASEGPLRGGGSETRIFITPGFEFKVVDLLLTNFHLPKSTLLMLVSAFAGLDNVRTAYAHAVRERYRFFSYGDAMLLERT